MKSEVRRQKGERSYRCSPLGLCRPFPPSVEPRRPSLLLTSPSARRGRYLRLPAAVCEGLAVEVFIAASRGVPGEVRTHAALLEHPPRLPILVRLDRAHDRGIEVDLVVALEREAVAGAGARIEVLDRIGEAAGVADDRDAAVVQADELAEAT